MTFNLIDMHVLPGTAWMADVARLAEACLVRACYSFERFCALPRPNGVRGQSGGGAFSVSVL